MTKVKINGMSCRHCVSHVTKALEGLPGVKNVKVNLDTAEATFDKPDSVTMDDVTKAVEDAGYEVDQT